MKSRQYTVRQVPDKVDSMVREQAAKYRKSMNTVLLEALARGVGADEEPTLFHDMDDLGGTWVEDDEFHRAIAAFEVVDEDLWK